jgi:hypothetical protein
MIDVLSDEPLDPANHAWTVTVSEQTSVPRARCHNPRVSISDVLLTQKQPAAACISSMPLLRRLQVPPYALFWLRASSHCQLRSKRRPSTPASAAPAADRTFTYIYINTDFPIHHTAFVFYSTVNLPLLGKPHESHAHDAMKLLVFLFALMNFFAATIAGSGGRDLPTCKDESLQCGGGNPGGGVFVCRKGSWDILVPCAAGESCVTDPVPTCTWAKAITGFEIPGTLVAADVKKKAAVASTALVDDKV